MNRLLSILAAVCVLLGAADFVIHKHGHYAWEEWPFGQGLFGLGACVVLVLLALGAGKALRRPEDYYDE